MRNTSLLTVLLFATALAGLMAGCGSDSTVPGDGRIRVELIDAAAPYDSVIIAVDRVEVHRADADSESWITLDTAPARYDLLQLVNGAQAVLADHPLVPGHYTMMRLVLGAGSYVVDGGVSHELVVPSGMQTGIKLNVPFDIAADQLYEVTLDFDAARSIHIVDHDRYQMQPVIRAVWHAIAGTIHGTVSPSAALPLVWTVAGPDTISTPADPLSGEFRLMMLPAGTYAVHISPTNTAYRDSVVSGVVVTAEQETELGTIELQAAP